MGYSNERNAPFFLRAQFTTFNDGLPMKNRIREIREEQLMSKAELARKAGISPVTVDRIEGGAPCRMSTKRKIILALGLGLADRDQVFPENNG